MVMDYTSVSQYLVDAAMGILREESTCGLTVRPNQRHGCGPMQLETRFLRLKQPVVLGEQIDGWRVCWLSGWDKGRIFFIVMVVRKRGSGR